MIVQVGNTGFNLKQLKELGITSEKEFKKFYSHIPKLDLNKAWKLVNKELKKLK